uniref:Uncharacterized protein n=1 Tax=Rhizophora mucronata TaxID=61149 RepID=A0A2P2J0T9_RHIMU
MLTNGQLNSAEDIFQCQTSTWPAVSTWGQGNALFLPSGNEGESGIISSVPSFDVYMPRIGSPRGRWCKLRAALWWDSIRRDVAAKKSWQGLCI